MRRTTTRSLAVALSALGIVTQGCDTDKTSGTASSAKEARPTATLTDTSAERAAAPPAVTADALKDTAAAPSAVASVAPSHSDAAPTGSSSAGAGAPAKTFDCGAKGQKPCPMQGWMKSVMGAAALSGDKAKLASALSYVASRPPPGFGTWTSIANDGVAKAKAGDIDGSKVSCKQCHDAYKEKYRATLRDRPF